MPRFFYAMIVAVILVISFAQTSQAGLLYSKPEFRGRVIDAETKQPIEGAVVVILYYKRSTFSLNPGGPNSYITKAGESLTDDKGEFYFPPYSELMLFTEDVGAEFIFFKPGYMSSYGPTNIKPTLIEKYFSADEIGKVSEIETGSFEDSSYVKWKGPLGIMELKKGERDPSTPTDYRSKELPLLFNALNEDRKNRGYKGELK